LFQEQARYQTTLRQASLGMGRIKDLKRLVTLIVHIVTRTVRVDHTIIYIKDRRTKNFLLGAVRSRQVRFSPQEAILQDSPLVHELNIRKIPIVYDEIQQQTKDFGDMHLARVEADLKALDAALVVPSFIDDEVVGIIILGKKASGRPYSTSDIAVFSILANQMAVGMENAFYFRDLSETRERLFNVEKLAYVGQLAGSVVHEIRNPLTAIRAFMQYLPQKYGEPEFREKFDRLIPKEIERIENIVNQMLSLARRRPQRQERLNVEHVIDTTLELLENSFQLGNIKVKKIFRADDGTVIGDEEILRQAFMNLFLNAVQAMGGGGTLTVSTSVYGLPCAVYGKIPAVLTGTRSKANMSPSSESNMSSREHVPDKVIVEIADTGCGMTPQQLEKLFVPFQTTKPNGVGLGLSITKEIVESHGGEICARSEVGKGTVFVVELPVKNVKT